VLVDDVRDERARVAVRPQARAGLVSDQIALGDEADLLGALALAWTANDAASDENLRERLIRP
jgi:hypothetical protein